MSVRLLLTNQVPPPPVMFDLSSLQEQLCEGECLVSGGTLISTYTLLLKLLPPDYLSFRAAVMRTVYVDLRDGMRLEVLKSQIM